MLRCRFWLGLGSRASAIFHSGLAHTDSAIAGTLLVTADLTAMPEAKRISAEPGHSMETARKVKFQVQSANFFRLQL